jgi:anti-sigma regulatory factor (Ser/Thr protein kinase)
VQGLDRQTNAPGLARRHVRDFCRDLYSADLTDDVELVVSELVTNAVLHGAGRITLRLELLDGVVSVGVKDGGPGGPRLPGVARLIEEGGRGMALVARLVRDWGVRSDDNGGKEVWAVVAGVPAR